MQILIIGGFLGSGKTTILRQLIQGLVQNGQTCAIIENEIGQVGIDDVLLGGAGLSITPLFGGCVCCQITGDLFSAIDRIQKEIAPDWLMVEMTGIAMMDSIRDTFGTAWKKDIHTLSVVDMSRWDRLVGPLSSVFTHQVAGADVVFVNKIDVRRPTEETDCFLQKLAPDAIIVHLEKELKENPKDLWQAYLRCIRE